MLADLDLAPQLLPGLRSPGDVLGRVSPDATLRTGLPAGGVIRAGMTDGCAAQIAAGALAPGDWSSALGTTLVVKGATQELLRDPSGAVYCHRSPDGYWLPGGASSTGAGVLATQLAGRDLDRLTQRARTLVPAAGTTYPLGGTGERFPFLAPQAHGFSTAAPTDDAGLLASLCQGIGYVERLAYDVLGHLGADVSGTVTMTGGTARNSWWTQLRADILGRPAIVPVSADSATGMAILAASEPGRLAVAAERMVRVRDRFEPRVERGEDLRPGYHRLVTELADRGWLDQDVATAVLSSTTATSSRSRS